MRGPAHALLTVFVAVMVATSAGCRPAADDSQTLASPDPVRALQQEAYPEAATGRFVSLADFEDRPDGRAGRDQLRAFAISPASQGASLRFVRTVTRTGSGAMEAVLPVGSDLVMRLAVRRDIRRHTLLAVALHLDAYRDDLRITIISDEGSWISPRQLVRPGWNNVMVDLRPLHDLPGFDPRGVREIRLGFGAAAAPIVLHADDLMLVDNTRVLAGEPGGLELARRGLNLEVKVPGWERPFVLAQSADGLWRLEHRQPVVRLGSQAVSGPDVEDLGPMAGRRIGSVEIVETGPVRVRLVNTWYFPARSGEWVSMGVRQIRWEYTFYRDGRWVTHVEVNNAGGRPLESASIRPLLPAAWAGGGLGPRRDVEALAGSIGRWSWMVASGPQARALQEGYLQPGEVELLLGDGAGESARAARQGPGFDQTEGAWRLGARAGHCRFRIVPGPLGLQDPAFRVQGDWAGEVSVSSQGLAIRQVQRLEDGAVVFRLPGRIERPMVVEVRGPAAPWVDRGMPQTAPTRRH